MVEAINPKKYGKISFIAVLLVIAIYFWINGSSFFPNWNATYGNTILVYIIMLTAFLVFSLKKIQEEIQEPVTTSIIKFVTGVFGCFLVMEALKLSGFITPGIISPDLIFQNLIMQFCVVAAAEEVIFRGVFIKYLNLGIVFSAFLFAIWHSAAYGIQWTNITSETNFIALIFAFIFGCLLGYLVVYQNKRVGIPGAIGIHAIYNLAILGVVLI